MNVIKNTVNDLSDKLKRSIENIEVIFNKIRSFRVYCPFVLTNCNELNDGGT